MRRGGRLARLSESSNVEGVPRSGVLLVNAKSRNGLEWFPQVRNRLIAGGIDLQDARRFRGAKELVKAVHDYISQGSPLVIVGGGDGTFGAVAHMFARRQTVLGVLPLGTGNAFARDLHITDTLDASCEAILNGKIASVDMGLIGDRVFVNLATVGLSTKIAMGLNDRAKRKLGKSVYMASVCKALATVEPFHVKLELPGQTEEFESLQVVIGNGRFHAGPFQISPDASLTAGWLSIYALASPHKTAFFKLALHMVMGGKLDLEQVKVFRAQSGTLTTIGPKWVTVDGEIAMTTPVQFGMVPAALRVAVPTSFEG